MINFTQKYIGLFALLFTVSITTNAQEIQDPCFSANDFSNLILESNPPIAINMPEGWSMFGYTCNEPIDLIDAFQEISSDVTIVKNYFGLAYLPDWGFNAIGDLEPGLGYQIKLEVAKNDFTFCDGILIPEIYGCTDCESENYNVWANINDGSCIYYGCTNENYLEYDSNANTDDGSCYTFLSGCLDEDACNFNPAANVDNGNCEFAEQGFNCDGYQITGNYLLTDSLFIDYLQQYYPEVIINDSLNIDLANTIEIEYLELNGNFENIDGIQYFTNLVDLFISANPNLTSIPDLSGLTNLASLAILDNDNLTSVPDLSGLTNLSYLYIALNNNLTSLPDLSGLTNLAQLIIRENYNLTSVPDLSGLTNLSWLYLGDGAAVPIPLDCVGGYPEQLAIQEYWPPVCEE